MPMLDQQQIAEVREFTQKRHLSIHQEWNSMRRRAKLNSYSKQ
jgi:hypothetical protein